MQVFEIFERAGLGVANYDTQVKRLQRSIDRLMDEAGLLEKTFTPSLDSFMKAVKVIFRLGEFEAVKASLPYYAGYIKQVLMHSMCFPLCANGPHIRTEVEWIAHPWLLTFSPPRFPPYSNHRSRPSRRVVPQAPRPPSPPHRVIRAPAC